jgi:uncharacterized protein YegL
MFLETGGVSRAWPYVVLLDTSAAMSSTDSPSLASPIDLLNRALPTFREQLLCNSAARTSVNMAMITFGGTPALVQDWTNVQDMSIPVLTPAGSAPLGPAILMALDMLEARRAWYRQNFIPSYIPRLIILTEGLPDPDTELTAAIGRLTTLQKIAAGAKSPKLEVYAINIKPDPWVTRQLKSITNRTYELKDMAFRELFGWMSNLLLDDEELLPEQVTFV